MKKPLVSVLIPVYNSSEFISSCIKSVLDQSYKNFELIILDDCSTDDSFKIISSFKDSRIKIFRNSKNLGRPKTYNKLLSLISSDSSYFFFVGSDDLIKKDLILDKVNYMESHPSIYGLGSAIDIVDSSLNLIKVRSYPSYVRKVYLLYSPFSQGGMFLRSSLKKFKFNTSFKVCLDYELWCRLIPLYSFENLSKSYYIYRQQENQAKQKNLKLTVWNTLRIKSRYFSKFGFLEWVRFFLETCLLVLPSKVVLWLFYRNIFKKG